MDYLCALGDDPYVVYNKLKFESMALGLGDIMIPLQTSYTQSSKGGRPEETDESNLSPEGQATRDSGKNDDKGNK